MASTETGVISILIGWKVVFSPAVIIDEYISLFLPVSCVCGGVNEYEVLKPF